MEEENFGFCYSEEPLGTSYFRDDRNPKNVGFSDYEISLEKFCMLSYVQIPFSNHKGYSNWNVFMYDTIGDRSPLFKFFPCDPCQTGLALPHNESLSDIQRVDYLKGYINATLRAIRDGSNVKRILRVVIFMDQISFGLYHVDFDKELRRRPKLYAHWYPKFLRNIKEKKMREGWCEFNATFCMVGFIWLAL